MASDADKNYKEHNKRTFDLLAPQYEKRRISDVENDKKLLAPVLKTLNTSTGGKSYNQLRALDLGCGAGLNVNMFTNLGFETCGVDFSQNMIRTARKFTPSANFICEEFSELVFPDSYFDLIIAKASIHLLRKQDAILVFERAAKWLSCEGVFFVTTTEVNVSGEGYYTKADYAGGERRFKSLWTKRELVSTLQCCFSKVKAYRNKEIGTGKSWINVICCEP